MKRIDLDQLVRSIDSKDIIEIGAEKIHDIAIIGMSVVLPQAKDVGEYWEMLKNGRDCISDLPPHRKSEADAYLRDLGRKVEEVRYKRGSYLERIDEFDCRFFNISPREAGLMDPNQRLFLENVWSAIEDAGYGGDKLKGSRTGVYCGFVADLGYQRLIAAIEPTEVGNSIPGNMAAIIPGRVSYFLDLKGPSVLLDTACSSSLVAIHAACQGIRNGDCEMAIAGSVKINLLPLEDDNMLGIESKNYICRAFDDDADGTCMGEGVLAIILKPLNKAVQDKDHIYAVIKGSAINQDGATMGITAPNAMAQAEVIEKAWSDAGVDPETITYIEAHGTGTKLGDPIEIDGINRAFSKYTAKKRFCAIGSVKTNLGHLDSAAGMAGLIKAVLALEHKQIPASLNFKKPNRNIDFENSPVFVNDQLIDWQTDGFPRRCGISAFGLSGTNSHIVLEEAPPASEQSQEIDTSLQIFTLSAKSETVLKKLVARYTNHLATRPEINLKDLCYTANTGRGHYRNRLAIIAATLEELTEKITYLNQTGLISNESKDIYYREVKLSPQTNEIDSETVGEGIGQSRDSQNQEELLKGVCGLYIQGAEVQWDNLYSKGNCRRISLPGYAFERRRRWIGTPHTGEPESAQTQENQSVSVGKTLNKNGLVSETAANSQQQQKDSGGPGGRSSRGISLTGRDNAQYSDNELIVGQVWGEILGFDTLSIDSNLYELGGDSIIAMQITNLLENEYGIKPDVAQVLKYQTIRTFAHYLDFEYQQQTEVVDSAEDQLLETNDAAAVEFSDNSLDLPEASVSEEPRQYDIDISESKILPLKFQNDITSYLHYMLPLTVVLMDERLVPWFYEHFINIFTCMGPFNLSRFDFLEYEFIRNQFITSIQFNYEMLLDVPEIIPFITDKINRGYYAIIYLDEYYLPEKDSYHKKHLMRASLIYGYHHQERRLLAVGFNKQQILGKITFDYDQFREAYENGKVRFPKIAPWAEKEALELLKFKNHATAYPFDLTRFLGRLDDYLESRGDNSVIYHYEIPDENVTYGAAVYDEVVRQLQNISIHHFTLDYVPFHFLAEHKKGIYNRLRYIGSRYQVPGDLLALIDEYYSVVEQFEAIRIKCLQLNYTMDLSRLFKLPKLVKELIEGITSAQAKEGPLLSEISSRLRLLA
jgi:3-oxoacyl-(acyl-carrier-protein) synthase/acyl carrier protein